MSGTRTVVLAGASGFIGKYFRTRFEQDGVATVIAAIIWAVLDASVRDLDDTLLA